jgi:hypothetical protein
VWRKSVFDIYFTEFGAAFTTVLPVLFKYCYKYCYSDSRKLWVVMIGGNGALKSDSTHHFFRNACTKSGSLRFSQFIDCWLILSVYILMSFDFPFVRLLSSVILLLPLLTQKTPYSNLLNKVFSTFQLISIAILYWFLIWLTVYLSE